MGQEHYQYKIKPNEIFFIFIIYMKWIAMGKLQTIILIFVSTSLIWPGNIYKTKYKSDADVKVYKVQHKSEADLIVYVSKYSSEANEKDEIWYYTKYKSDADCIVKLVDYRSEADVKVYFTKYKSEAGWKEANAFRDSFK
jgi:hypothetical protein